MGRWGRMIDVQIDVSDVIDQLDDEDLIDELKARKPSLEGLAFDRDYAERALISLMAGQVSDAVALLDRALHPYPTYQAASLMTLFQHAKTKED